MAASSSKASESFEGEDEEIKSMRSIPALSLNAFLKLIQQWHSYTWNWINPSDEEADKMVKALEKKYKLDGLTRQEILICTLATVGQVPRDSPVKTAAWRHIADRQSEESKVGQSCQAVLSLD
jgi:hypothetical protein